MTDRWYVTFTTGRGTYVCDSRGDVDPISIANVSDADRLARLLNSLPNKLERS